MNGVAIGKVYSIDLFYDQTNKVYTAVVVQLDRQKLKRISMGGHPFDEYAARQGSHRRNWAFPA